MSRSHILIVGASAFLLLIAGILLLPIGLSAFGPRLILRPRSLSPAEADPGYWGLAAEQVRFRTSDGITLHGWWAPTVREPACGAVVLFHGRSANISTRSAVVPWLTDLGYDTFLFDYRGFGASEGTLADEEALHRDALAAYRFVTERRGVAPERLVLLGQSMGTAVASRVAAQVDAAALILVSPFTSGPGLLRQHLPRWMPDGWPEWQRNRFEVRARLTYSGEPLVVAVSRADRQVPYAESRALFDAVPGAKRWVEVDGVGHNGLLQSAILQRQLTPALQDLVPCPRSGPA